MQLTQYVLHVQPLCLTKHSRLLHILRKLCADLTQIAMFSSLSWPIFTSIWRFQQKGMKRLYPSENNRIFASKINNE